MDTNTLILVLGLLFLGIVILFAVLFSAKREKLEVNLPTEKVHLEFSKLIMLIMMCMWVFGGLVGFWVVVCKDFSLLSEVQSYVSYPVTAGIAFYSAKSGAENIKKLSGKTTDQTEYFDESETEEH